MATGALAAKKHAFGQPCGAGCWRRAATNDIAEHLPAMAANASA